jgi:outer membrane protein
MKNLSLILNGVLFVAVATLFFLHFSGKKSTSGSTSPGSPSNLKIAYVNFDSLLVHYDFFKDNRDILEAKGKKLEQDLRSRAQGFQGDVEAFQRNAGNLTPNQSRDLQEQLGKKEQNLQLYQQSLQKEMSDDQLRLGQNIYAKLSTFLKKYGEANGLEAVFKFDSSSDVLFGSPGLDITKDVVAGLNTDYKAEKSNPVKADSVGAKKK